MKKALLLVFAMALAPASAAFAGVLLGWGDSPTNGAPTTLVSDCQSNLGSSTLVVSVVLPADVSGVTGFRVDLKAQDAASFGCEGPLCPLPLPLPPYWQLGAGGCRAGALSMGGGSAGAAVMDPSPVVDPWQGGLQIVIRHAWETVNVYSTSPPETSSYGRCGVEAALPAGTTVDLLAGHEYYIATFTIRHDKSIVPGGCAGCCAPIWFIPTVHLIVPPATDLVYDQQVFDWGIPMWQGMQATGCTAVPARTSTWGALKSTYR